MKRLIILLSILICLIFNVFNIIPTFASTTFNEGMYHLSDFNPTPNNRYTIQNISSDKSVYVLIFDENQRQLQSIYLSPKSENYSLIPLDPNYRLIIIGKGEVIIA